MRAGLLLPVEAGIGPWLESFRRNWFIPSTKAAEHWQARPLTEAMAWVPGRMVDQVQDMLDAWARNDNSITTNPATPKHKGTSARLPQLLLCVAKDYTPLPVEAGRQVTQPLAVTIPGDPKSRVLRVRLIGGEVRAQIVIVAAERETAREIAAQFLHYWSDQSNRSYRAVYDFAGMPTTWPVTVKAQDAMAVSTPPQQSNITILSIDLTLQFSVPQFIVPAAGQPNDGTGTSPDDPSGYRVADSFEMAHTGWELDGPVTGMPATDLSDIKDAS